MIRFFKSTLKKHKKYRKVLSKTEITCYDDSEIELIHFLIAEEECFSFIWVQIDKKLK